jgi:RNA polymerase sigma factor (sigma-70 family)
LISSLRTSPNGADHAGRNAHFTLDTKLLARAKKGNKEAFGELCKRHAEKIFHVTLRITRNREDAEDAVQECFLNALLHLNDFDERSLFSTWLTRIAINAALMKIRKVRTSRETPLLVVDEFGEERECVQLTDRSLNPEDSFAERERAKVLRDALGRLRPRIRAAIEFRQLHEYSIRDTARKLGISEAATKGRLFQARAVLRKVSRLKAVAAVRVGQAA